LNFPPYDVIGIKLKSMISATKKLVWGAKFALYENFSSFDCTKTIVFIRIILHVMGAGRFDE
jgi:hypothetical protein